MNRALTISAWLVAAALLLAPLTLAQDATKDKAKSAAGFDPTAAALAEIATLTVGKLDWPQWGGSAGRNNTPQGLNIPITWDTETGTNIKWKANLGSQTYGNPVMANGKVYVGTNNGAGLTKRYPASVDLGCMLCFEAATGKLLWQHSNPKLRTGRVHDWPLQGICDSPFVDGKRVWYVTSRGTVVCVDTEGFHDGKNNGPFTAEPNENKDEADVIWEFDMMKELRVSQHNMCSCSVTCAGDVLFVNTSNGVSFEHLNVPSPEAPSFIAMNRDTGKVLWTNKLPSTAILHGQWSSPTYGVLGGEPQVIFAGGDGWVYSFDPKGDGKGGSRLLWRFDGNPKESKWILGGRGTRNNIIATPVIYDGLVYVVVGQDPEHGEGMGHVWALDPTRRGDTSPTRAMKADGTEIPFEKRRRLQYVIAKDGETIQKNSNSAVVWHYGQKDEDEYNAADFEQQMHRSLGTVAIKNNLLFIADFSGLFHCLDAKTGKRHWSYDMFAASWGSPLIVDGKVYIGDEDGDVAIFPLTADPKKALKDVDGELEPALGVVNMGNSIYSTPIVANNVLYIANKSTLFAIEAKAK
jgi:outer membrane protein assembly factor BamB